MQFIIQTVDGTSSCFMVLLVDGSSSCFLLVFQLWHLSFNVSVIFDYVIVRINFFSSLQFSPSRARLLEHFLRLPDAQNLCSAVSKRAKVDYRVQKSLLTVSIVSQMNPVHTLPSCFLNINFIIFPCTSISSERCLPFRLHNQN
jgi:hypothetical protein